MLVLLLCVSDMCEYISFAVYTWKKKKKCTNILTNIGFSYLTIPRDAIK